MKPCVIGTNVNRDGYARMWRDGKTVRAARYVCTQTYGPPPSDEHECAHSCNNRACIEPEHLRWATPKENLADRIAHGTAPLGENNPRAKLSDADVTVIRELKGKVFQADLATWFGVSQSHVSHVQTQRTRVPCL